MPSFQVFWLCFTFNKCVFPQCSSASKLMQSHGIGTQALLTATEFSYLCPALINQIDGKCCIVHASSEKTETPPKGYSLQIGRFPFLIWSKSLLETRLCSLYVSETYFRIERSL